MRSGSGQGGDVRHRLWRRRVGAILIMVVLSAASFASAGVIRHDTADSAYVRLGSKFGNVGQFRASANGRAWAGSGVLVANDWVITAGHVVDDAKALRFNIGGQSYQGKQWLAHNNWRGNPLSGFDLALVQLDRAVTGARPAALYGGAGEVGRVARSVGFGLTGDGLTGYDTRSGLNKRGGNNVIDALAGGNRVLISDFDAPGPGADGAVLGSDRANRFEYLIAPGDSGGGLFIRVGKRWRLAGVHSFGLGYDGRTDSDYGDWSGHTRVSPFTDWIDAVIHADGVFGVEAGEGLTWNQQRWGLGVQFGPATYATAAPAPAALPGAILLLAVNSARRRRVTKGKGRRRAGGCAWG